jgi:hypothetical protein
MQEQWRKSITTLAFVLAWAVSAGASAQAPKTPLAVKPDAPERYIVVPGDTLWSIAQRYTDSPWRWPELWSLNKDEIKNPNRIYPGNVIVLDRARGRLTLSDTVKLSPHLRAESIAQAAIPSIPPSIIEPFLARPLVIEPDGLDNAPTIIAAGDLRVAMETSSRAFVRGIGDSKESSWFVYRRGQPLVDPDSNTTLGYEAIYLGTARTVRAGEPAVIELTSVTREVQIGDKLVAAGRLDIPTYAPRAPSTRVQGRIISIYGDSTTLGEAGAQSVITINRGRSQGIEVGDVVALYRSGAALAADTNSSKGSKKALAIVLPDERYGVAFIFRVFDRVSYALVMNISRPVNKLDLVQNP